MSTLIQDLPIRIFADGADKPGILELYAKPYIKGLTTNPMLMRKAGIKDYETFARDILVSVTAKPISFSVFSNEFPEMRRHALKIASWADNVFVKIPVTNSRGESSIPLIQELAQERVRINVTAILTHDQVTEVARVLNPEVPSVVSVFAGRIADTGTDPVAVMRACLATLADLPHAHLLWASVREVINIYQAAACRCGIVTVPHDILAKAVKMAGMDHTALSLDTVRMFAKDAVDAGFQL